MAGAPREPSRWLALCGDVVMAAAPGTTALSAGGSKAEGGEHAQQLLCCCVLRAACMLSPLSPCFFAYGSFSSCTSSPRASLSARLPVLLPVLPPQETLKHRPACLVRGPHQMRACTNTAPSPRPHNPTHAFPAPADGGRGDADDEEDEESSAATSSPPPPASASVPGSAAASPAPAAGALGAAAGRLGNPALTPRLRTRLFAAKCLLQVGGVEGCSLQG